MSSGSFTGTGDAATGGDRVPPQDLGGGLTRMPEAPVSEHRARSVPGWGPLAGGLAALAAGIALQATLRNPGAAAGGAVLEVAAVFALVGLTAISPGQARVVTIFGRYKGTLRATGLQWVLPFARRRRISTRVRNLETATLKVSDADGNPIEMAAVVVWQVEDTAKAFYAVDQFPSFVGIQTETAVRHIASAYAYDSREDERLSLRQNAEEITGRLSAEIAARVALAGITVVESRITRLSYAPEIAQVMLRRQQADAIVAARQRIVEGAVGMVRQAIDALSEQEVIDLDEERKAAMVSNLLVVLCSEHPTQPVVNTGTLYQ